MVIGEKPVFRFSLHTLPKSIAATFAVIHFCATVRTEHRPRQRIGLASGAGPAYSLPDAPGQSPAFRVNAGLMGILENQTFFQRMLDHFLLFTERLAGAEIDRMAHMLHGIAEAFSRIRPSDCAGWFSATGSPC